MAVRIVDVGFGDPVVERVYEELLRPGFPPDELLLRSELDDALRQGSGVLAVALDEAGDPRGAAVGEWRAGSGVLLLSYLAVRGGQRSAGIGSRLMEHVGTHWQRSLSPRMTLAEVEHPMAHPASEHGDPVARLRFYWRRGARALDVPYVQPALRKGTRRVPDMLLLLLLTSSGAPPHREEDIDAETVLAFLRDHFVEAEGEEALEDRALDAMWEAVRGRPRVPLLDLADTDRLPRATG
ncbi:N-acetyltransferase [Streptomyces sp. ST2-7A]|uniref:N-acetyltransferase n=1 Tax=Streptomyces sp. ST2-7A TaxID=2907214 RepID=UPI001F346C75|nr:N-acetyltransferase [Streptomyces sp. ST2-7A]MCE7082865.1 N-acetyltransferase [Streptomyces sp. ST2-7A]